jgi:membrane protease YdiL (CAAX protease family)
LKAITYCQKEKRKLVMKNNNNASVIPQYALSKILSIWAAAVIPMALLGWIVGPALAPDPQNTRQFIFTRLAVLAVGLAWQFVLILILLYQETGNLRWSVIRQRLWLNKPRSPQTGEPRGRFWWWLVPIIILTALYEMQVGGMIDKLWTSIFPFFAEPQGASLSAALAAPEAKSRLVGAWGIFALFIFQALFNTVLGEELLFRGLLLPRMAGVFGKWDWVMNGLLFGLYHLHVPWVILSGAIEGAALFALPSRYYRSSWFGIIAHSGQSIYFAFLILGLVLGLA